MDEAENGAGEALRVGVVGIGVMGSNLLLNMADHGFSVIGYDLKQERADKLESAASPGTGAAPSRPRCG